MTAVKGPFIIYTLWWGGRFLCHYTKILNSPPSFDYLNVENPSIKCWKVYNTLPHRLYEWFNTVKKTVKVNNYCFPCIFLL